MALSQLPLTKRKTLIKIFGNLKKKYKSISLSDKSLQKFSHTDGFQLMRRIVEYPLKESNVNQSFNNTFNSSNLFIKERINIYTDFYKRNGKPFQKKKTNKKIKYSRFFTKTPNNRDVYIPALSKVIPLKMVRSWQAIFDNKKMMSFGKATRLASLKIQISNITNFRNPPFFSTTSNGNSTLLPAFLRSSGYTLQVQLTSNQEENHTKTVGFITKKKKNQLQFNFTIPIRTTRKTWEIKKSLNKTHNIIHKHKIRKFDGNKPQNSKIQTNYFLTFLHNYKHPVFKHPALPCTYFPWKLEGYHQRWYTSPLKVVSPQKMHKEVQTPKTLTITTLHTFHASPKGLRRWQAIKDANDITAEHQRRYPKGGIRSMWCTKKGTTSKSPTLKLRKHSDTNTQTNKNTKTTSVLANQKIFTYFNNSIYLYWFVGQQQNKYEFWPQIDKKFNTFTLPSQYYPQKSDLAPNLFGTIKNSVPFEIRAINTIFDVQKQGGKRYNPINIITTFGGTGGTGNMYNKPQKRNAIGISSGSPCLAKWDKCTNNEKANMYDHFNFATTKNGMVCSTYRRLEDSNAGILSELQKSIIFDGNVRWLKDGIRTFKDGKKEFYASNQLLTYGTNSWIRTRDMSVCNSGKESVFQGSKIPLLSESDQVTFVADFGATLNQRTVLFPSASLMKHKFTPYVSHVLTSFGDEYQHTKSDIIKEITSERGKYKKYSSFSLNKMITPSSLFWGIPFFGKNSRNALPHIISTLLFLKEEQANTVNTVPQPYSSTNFLHTSIAKGKSHILSDSPSNPQRSTIFLPPFNFQEKYVLNTSDALQSESMKHVREVIHEIPTKKLPSIKSSMSNTFTIFPGQLLTYGDTISNDMVTTESGQILYVDSQKTIIRKAQTVLLYSQAIIAVLSGEWIKKGTPLMSLSYQKLVTGDIVQGLPKIEQFFEAPVLKDGTFWSDSLQAKLNQFFQEQREQFPLAEAVRKGFSEIQRVLVEGVQRVYISQGVLIADKHLEVIVRQMTCKGRILYSGDTGFLRNELVSLDKIESVNQVTYGQKALYHPQVRGITDASLESESFLSAASFQETTRVLSRDAIIGKTDLMRGLKERVIVGELIQAGTGLANNSVYNLLD